MRRIAAAALLCAVFLAGCATRQQEPVTVPPGTRTIGAAIGIGDTITFDNLAHFGIGSVYEKADVKQWKLDEVVHDAIRQAVGSRYAVVPAKVDVARFGSGRTYYANYSEAFATGFAKTPAIYAEHFSSEDKPDPGYPFDAIESSEPADLYLVVMPAHLGGNMTGVHGLGIGRRSIVMGVVHRNFLFTGFSVALVDKAQRKILGSVRVSGEPYRDIPGALWEESLAEMSPEQQEELRATMTQMLQSNMAATLAKFQW